MQQVSGVKAFDEGEDVVVYKRGTGEWSLKHAELPPPAPRTLRENAYLSMRPKPRDRWINVIKAIIARNELRAWQFSYSELGKGEIRILCVYPANDEMDPLRATMFKRKLEDVRDGYEALSYTWGNPRAYPLEQILIRDLDAKLTRRAPLSTSATRSRHKMATNAVLGTPFHIGRNLYQALIALRKQSDSPVNLWVDAICIDQSERGHRDKEQQLAMMAQIFNYASNVCIWLGDSFDNPASAFNLVREIMNFKNFDRIFRSSESKNKWIQLIDIMKAPWLSRRWITQEVALAKNASLHCGNLVVHWDDFADAVALLLEKIGTLRGYFNEEVFDDIELTNASILIH